MSEQGGGQLPVRDIGLAVAVAAVWGLNFVVIEVGLRDLPPLLFAALRFTLVALPAVLFVRRPQIPTHLLVLIGLFLGVGQFGLLFVGMDLGMAAGLASLVMQCQAIFTVALAVLLIGETPSSRQLAGAGIAFGGIAIVALGRDTGVSLIAMLLVIAAAASWGASNVVTRIARAPSGLALVIWASLVPPLPLMALSVVVEGPSAAGDALSGIGMDGVLAERNASTSDLLAGGAAGKFAD